MPWPLMGSRGAGRGGGVEAEWVWVVGGEGGLGGRLTTRGDARDNCGCAGRPTGSGRLGGELEAVTQN